MGNALHACQAHRAVLVEGACGSCGITPLTCSCSETARSLENLDLWAEPGMLEAGLPLRGQSHLNVRDMLDTQVVIVAAHVTGVPGAQLLHMHGSDCTGAHRPPGHCMEHRKVQQFQAAWAEPERSARWQGGYVMQPVKSGSTIPEFAYVASPEYQVLPVRQAA